MVMVMVLLLLFCLLCNNVNVVLNCFVLYEGLIERLHGDDEVLEISVVCLLMVCCVAMLLFEWLY